MMVPPAVGNGGAAQELFDGDVVERTTQPGLLGTVVQQDSEDSDGYTSAEDPDDAAAAGFVDVVWLDAPVAAQVPVVELRLVDRPFKHNDLVRWTTAENPVGRVVEVRVVVDLRMLDDGAVMSGVDTREVAKVRVLAADDVVVKGKWVGRVIDLEEHVKVKFDAGGAVRTVVKADPETLVPGDGGADPGRGLFPYYPGQRVTVASAQAMDGALGSAGAGGAALPSTFPAAATVVDVSVGAVTVQWAHRRAGSTEPEPSEDQPNPRGLKPLTHLRYADWKLGDAGTVQGQGRRCGRVVRVRTEVDVAWLPGGASGGVSTDLPSYVLECRYPMPVERGVWPGDLVTELLPGAGDGKGAGYFDIDDGDGRGGVRRTGVVQRVDAARRLLAVKWMSPAGQPCGPAKVVGTDWGLEQERMGDIGDIVMRLQRRLPPAAAAAAAIAAAAFGRRAGGAKVPWMGQLLAARLDGTVSVVWSDGSRSHERRSDVRITPYYADESEVEA